MALVPRNCLHASPHITRTYIIYRRQLSDPSLPRLALELFTKNATLVTATRFVIPNTSMFCT